MIVRSVWGELVGDSLLKHPKKVMIIVWYQSLDMFIRVIAFIEDRFGKTLQGLFNFRDCESFNGLDLVSAS